MAATENLEMFREGDILTISIDLAQDFGPSSSGKTTVVASSRGNVEVPNSPGMFIGINVYKK